jgi:hypothetical protein
VRSVDGKAYGKIIAVYDFGAGDVFDIEKPNKKIEMLPLNELYIKLSSDGSFFELQPFEFTEAKVEK